MPSFHVPLGEYWKGGVWSPSSFQYIKGLDAYGYEDMAFEEVLLPRLREEIARVNETDEERQCIRIETAVLGNDAGIIGAVL